MHDGIRKLKLERFEHIGIRDLPPEVANLAELQPEWAKNQPPYDAIISFARSLVEMQACIDWAATGQLKSQGVLFILYPKRGNKCLPESIHRDEIFSLGVNQAGFFGETDLKLNSMTAFDACYTVAGIKRVPSKTYRAPARSQSVADYRHRLPELRDRLTPEAQVALDRLTPGYQVGWVRYCFSAVREATQIKRLAQAEAALLAGLQTIEQYRKYRSKK